MNSKLSIVRNTYIALWIVAIIMVLLGEFDVFGLNGYWVDKAAMAYYYETVVILATVIIVPLTLKYFAMYLKRKVDQMPLEKALRSYVLLSVGRIALLGIPVVLGIVGYYMLMNTSCILCALIALTATFFCWPSQNSMKRDLHIEDEEEA